MFDGLELKLIYFYIKFSINNNEILIAVVIQIL